MNYFKKAILGLIIFSSTTSFAQNNYEKSMQAMMKGDYKTAVTQLEKADTKTPDNANVLKMLGYSYFQNGEYEKCIATYSRLLAMKPNEVSAYYYRGKARLNIANDPKESLNTMRENFYTAAIKDFTKAIEINGDEDTQMFQNRGLAYKDYAIFKSYKVKKNTEKLACVALFNNSIADFQKVLTMQPLRKDIIDWVAYDKAQIVSLK
ncbi:MULTISPECIES: tetratricopeptide repeat protein [unclassified Pedobacter]|uniref:tetratricopeptide repeat protein n=1 Tax=Pedobacter TaxID=84567 RepID=UPI0022461E24|nr:MULTISPECIES: tetratricopeptide repeat protein [unclassified Pedobacter]MCX2429138.1 tetratricopeptide repeat protein [Pedobacter sp. GR22-10]MCX2583577.1 tetratricopeptide repeat protein [Pedobacter sp. MR22-3]